MAHKKAVITLKTRQTGNDLHTMLDAELQQERRYRAQVFKRVVSIIRKLTSRGFPLRGHDQQLGSRHNGNFLMAAELLAEFDPFMEEHLRSSGNPGSGKTSYLSPATYEEVTHIMARQCRELILTDVRSAKYFSIIVDSTPDI